MSVLVPPMAVDVMESYRKVAPGDLDVRPGRVQNVYGRKRVPLDFVTRALESLNAPCGCGMCRGITPWRSKKQAANYRNDLNKNRFKKAVVMCRDGWRCVLCGSEADLTIDHVRGVAKGGSNAYHNLRVLCLDCHVTRADSHQPRMLARHLANLVEDLMPMLDPITIEERGRVARVRRLIDSIRELEVA